MSAGTFAALVPSRADRPALGDWRLELPRLVCVETYLVRAHGTTIVTSGDEVSESVVDIADRPDAEGFHRWTDTIVRNDGKADCSGQVRPIGAVSTTSLRIDPSGEAMIPCFDHATSSCLGPVVRVRPQRSP